MSECEEEVGTRSAFGGSVASDERELAIDERVPQSSVVPSLQFVPDSNVVIREGEECVRRALEEVEPSDSRTEEASEGDSFVDIMFARLQLRPQMNHSRRHHLSPTHVQHHR